MSEEPLTLEQIDARIEQAERARRSLNEQALDAAVRIAWLRDLRQRVKDESNQDRDPASMFVPCEKCGASSQGVRRETVTQGEVVRPGFKCECGWWNWLDSPPSYQELSHHPDFASGGQKDDRSSGCTEIEGHATSGDSANYSQESSRDA